MRGSCIGMGVLAVLTAALFFTGCGVAPQEESAQDISDVESEVQVTRSCDAARLCSHDRYCARAGGACGSKGTCYPKPEECIQLDAPVCGCDGVTYSNACFAAMMGASVKSQGACDSGDLS